MTYSPELEVLRDLKIPECAPTPRGFLEIIDKSCDESINTKLYAYFLDRTLSPATSDLFMDALLEMIFEKTKKRIALQTYSCKCEVKTDRGNYIDLIIEDDDNGAALVIENKVYHHLNNDLEDYLQHCKAKNKVGIILSLFPIKTSHHEFINITHQDWMNRVVKAGLPAGMPSNEYVYLNDFINTIKYLTRVFTMNEQVDFFFKNTKQVLLADCCYKAAQEYIVNQLRQLAAEYDWKLYGTGFCERGIWDEGNNCNAYYWIDFTEMFSEDPTVKISLQLYGEDISRSAELYEKLRNNKYLNDLHRNGGNVTTHVDFAWATYPWDHEKSPSFAKFLSEHMKEKFDPLMRDVWKILGYDGPLQKTKRLAVSENL